MSWILVLALYSNDTGNYVRYFPSENACVQELKKFTQSNANDANVKFVGCVRAEYAMNEVTE